VIGDSSLPARREIEHGRDQDDAVERDIIVGVVHQLVGDGGRAGGAIAFAAEIFGAVPAAIVVEPQPDDRGDELGILRDAIIVLRVGLADQVRETGARRVDEHDVGDVEQGVGIIDDRIGRRAVVDPGAGDGDALGSEGAHHQPDGARTRAAVEQEGDRAVRVARLLDIGGGDDRDFGHAVLGLDDRLTDRRGVIDPLAAEGSAQFRCANLRGDVGGLFCLGLVGGRVLRMDDGRRGKGERQGDERRTRFHDFLPG